MGDRCATSSTCGTSSTWCGMPSTARRPRASTMRARARRAPLRTWARRSSRVSACRRPSSTSTCQRICGTGINILPKPTCGNGGPQDCPCRGRRSKKAWATTYANSWCRANISDSPTRTSLADRRPHVLVVDQDPFIIELGETPVHMHGRAFHLDPVLDDAVVLHFKPVLEFARRIGEGTMEPPVGALPEEPLHVRHGVEIERSGQAFQREVDMGHLVRRIGVKLVEEREE